MAFAFSLVQRGLGFEMEPKEPRIQFRSFFNFPEFPDTGVYVQSILLHMHKIGRKMYSTIHRLKPGMIGNVSDPGSTAVCPSECRTLFGGQCVKCFNSFCAGTKSSIACLGGQCCSSCSVCDVCAPCYPYHARVNPMGSKPEKFNTFDLACNMEYDFNQQKWREF